MLKIATSMAIYNANEHVTSQLPNTSVYCVAQNEVIKIVTPYSSTSKKNLTKTVC